MTRLRAWMWAVVWWWRDNVVVPYDLMLGRRHWRCQGCGSMDEEMDDPTCVFEWTTHGPIEVDRYGMAIGGSRAK